MSDAKQPGDPRDEGPQKRSAQEQQRDRNAGEVAEVAGEVAGGGDAADGVGPRERVEGGSADATHAPDAPDAATDEPGHVASDAREADRD